MTSFFEHQRTSYKRNYLRNLIVLASSDGTLGGEERELIARIGVKRGLKTWQIETLLSDTTAHDVFLPASVGNRMNMLYDLMQIIYADQAVDSREVEFLSHIVEAFKLCPEVIEDLTSMFEKSVPTTDEWNEFVDAICSDSMPDRH